MNGIQKLDNSGYSITKFGAEMEVWRASQEGVDVVIVNPGVILGSGFWTSGSGKMFHKFIMDLTIIQKELLVLLVYKML